MPTKTQRAAVWAKSDGRCWYCGDKLPEKGWHVDHLEPIGRESRWCSEAKRFVHSGDVRRPDMDDLKNMVPACRACNLHKSSFDLDAWRTELQSQVERARKYCVNFRTAIRFGLVTETKAPVLFWFERKQR